MDVPKDIQQQLAVPDWEEPMSISAYISRLPPPPQVGIAVCAFLGSGGGWVLRMQARVSCLQHPYVCLLRVWVWPAGSGFWEACFCLCLLSTVQQGP